MPTRGASAKRYAEAAFEIAKARSALDRWREDVEGLAEAAKVPEFVALLENPRLPIDQKRNVIRAAIPGIGDGAISLAAVLVVKGRFKALMAGVADEFQRLLDEDRGILRAVVVTAVEMDEARKQRIVLELSQATGKQVQVTTKVDPSVVGGMVVRVGDRVLDGSINSKLTALRRSLVHELA